jgi:hypothetical protein
MLQVVQGAQRQNSNTQRSKSRKYNVKDHKDILDYEKIMMKEKSNSSLKVNTSHKDGRLPELTPTMLPSIQNAVEHFRKTMKRTNKSCVHLPPLYQSCGVGGHSGRIKYKHRSLEDHMRYSENCDKLQYILHKDNVPNVKKSSLESLECSPPLISTRLSREIITNRQRDVVSENKRNNLQIESDEFKIIGDNDKGEAESENKQFEQTNDSELKTRNKFPEHHVPTKSSFASVPTEEQSKKKRVRFNLDPHIHKYTSVNTLKASRRKARQHIITNSYKFSYPNAINGHHKRSKTRIGTKQTFRGHHPDKQYLWSVVL